MSFHLNTLVLRKGVDHTLPEIRGAIKQWQEFLYGFFYDTCAITNVKEIFLIDGVFGNKTENLTKLFQKSVNLKEDGVVGPMTLAKALELGYGNFVDEVDKTDELMWNEKPLNMRSLSSSEKHKLFGEIHYKISPLQNNNENIVITNNWTANYLTKVNIPQLKNVQGAPKSCDVYVNKLIAKNFVNLWNEWEDEGNLNLILTWAGTWVPRLVRGSLTTLSSHAWGTAFDINAAWNPMGTRPPKVGEKGSVRKLVGTAVKYGFYWGNWFTRHDGMHFEATEKTLKDIV